MAEGFQLILPAPQGLSPLCACGCWLRKTHVELAHSAREPPGLELDFNLQTFVWELCGLLWASPSPLLQEVVGEDCQRQQERKRIIQPIPAPLRRVPDQDCRYAFPACRYGGLSHLRVDKPEELTACNNRPCIMLCNLNHPEIQFHQFVHQSYGQWSEMRD